MSSLWMREKLRRGKRRALSQLPVGYQFDPQLNVFWVVHIEHLDCGPAYRRAANNESALPLKVRFLCIVAGVKKRLDVTALWVDPRQVCSLMQVAAIAGKRQVYGVSTTAMFFGPDMVDMKPEDGEVFLP